ncbi:MAG: hypothetical protein QXE18_01355 [Thermoplasmata archaeon]
MRTASRVVGQKSDDFAEDSEAKRRYPLRATMFVAAMIMLSFFSYWNVFVLPMGSCSVSSLLDDSSSLYGLRLHVYGVMGNASASGFEITDIDTRERMYVVWVQGGDIPYAGTEIKVFGQLVQSSIGPAFLADSISVRSAQDQVLTSAWSISVFRLFIIFFICFIVMIALSCLSVLVARVGKGFERMSVSRALSESSSITGLVSLFLFVLLAFSEQLALGISSIFLLLSPIIMLSSVTVRRTRNSRLSLFSDAMPLIAGVSIIIWMLTSVIQAKMLVFDSVSSLIGDIVSVSTDSIIFGVIGLIALSLFMAFIRVDIENVANLIRRIEPGVK